MTRTPPLRRVVAVLGALALGAGMAVGSVALAAPTAAHGAVSDPPARVYGCWERGASNHTNPAMQTQDPQCCDAWQANPQAMWNWNGIFKEGANGNHEQSVPDGRPCSADNDLYAAADDPGPWRTTPEPYDFRLTLHDPSNHGAGYLKVSGATITQAWNGTASGSTISSASWNGALAPGGTASAGFLGGGSPSGLTATCSAT